MQNKHMNMVHKEKWYGTTHGQECAINLNTRLIRYGQSNHLFTFWILWCQNRNSSQNGWNHQNAEKRDQVTEGQNIYQYDCIFIHLRQVFDDSENTKIWGVQITLLVSCIDTMKMERYLWFLVNFLLSRNLFEARRQFYDFWMPKLPHEVNELKILCVVLTFIAMEDNFA